MIVFEEDHYTFSCPHCDGTIQVKSTDIACRVFRHAVFKQTKNPIPPHTSKQECERLVKEDLVNGCAKPFWFDGKIVKVCDYI